MIRVAARVKIGRTDDQVILCRSKHIGLNHCWVVIEGKTAIQVYRLGGRIALPITTLISGRTTPHRARIPAQSHLGRPKVFSSLATSP